MLFRMAKTKVKIFSPDFMSECKHLLEDTIHFKDIYHYSDIFHHWCKESELRLMKDCAIVAMLWVFLSSAIGALLFPLREINYQGDKLLTKWMSEWVNGWIFNQGSTYTKENKAI